jgi:hypothetical protein
MAMGEYWRQLYGVQHVIEGLVEQDVINALAARPAGPRNQAADDALFAELSTATVIAVSKQDYELAKRMFQRCYPIVRNYETVNNCEVHKGAIAFNVALANLRSNDFAAAMHYFQLAQEETRQTTADDGWGVFQSPLFQKNFWDILDLYQNQHPLELYQEFWATPFGSAAAQADWNGLSDHSKLNYIMINAERTSHRRLRAEPHMPMSQSIGLAYWNLISDLARLLETELSQKGFAQVGLLSKILSGINANNVTQHVGFRTEVNRLHGQHGVTNPAAFNAAYPDLHTRISDPHLALPLRIAAAAYLAGAIRNQVQHQVEITMTIFTDRAAAEFTTNTLLTLCRTVAWVA